jgi:hypothetical protein
MEAERTPLLPRHGYSRRAAGFGVAPDGRVVLSEHLWTQIANLDYQIDWQVGSAGRDPDRFGTRCKGTSVLRL